MKCVFLLWEDPRVDVNKLHGVVEIDFDDLAHLVAEKYAADSSREVRHAEFRGIADTNQMYDTLPRLNVGQTMGDEW